MWIDRRVQLLLLLTSVAGCEGPARIDPIASLKAHGHVSSIGFSPTGSILATAGGGRESPLTPYSSGVTLWDAASQRTLRNIPIPGQVQGIALAADGKTLAVADGDYSGNGHTSLFDTATGKSLKSLDASTGWVHGLAFSPDGKLLGTCGSTFASKASGQGYEAGKIMVWEVSGWRERSSHDWPEGTYRSIAFAPDGRAYVTGGGTCFLGRPDSGEVRLWDTATGQTLWSHQGHSQVVECVAFAPGGEIVASGGMDGLLKLWDASDGKEVYAARLGEACPGRVLSIAFSPDGKYLAAAVGSYNRGSSCGELRLLEVGTNPVRTTSILDLPSPITSVAFSPDGRCLAAGADEGTVRLWEAAKVLGKVPKD